MENDLVFYYSPTQNPVLTIPQGLLGTPKDITDKNLNYGNVFTFTLSPISGTDCYAF